MSSLIEQGTPDYSSAYRPLDSAAFGRQEAQLHYMQLQNQMREGSVLLQNRSYQNMQMITGQTSMMGLRSSTLYGPSSNEVHDYNFQSNVYSQDLADRGTEMIGNAYGSFVSPVASMGLAFWGDNWADKNIGRKLRADKLMRGRAMGLRGAELTKFARGAFGTAALGRGALSMGVGALAGSIPLFLAEGAGRFAGVDDAFTQFKHINELGIASESWTAGTSSNPVSGGMARSEVKKIYDFVREEATLGKTRSGGKSFKELLEDVGSFNDHNLMQGVRSAEEFKKKFTSLTTSVQKITETLGKSFEEGLALMSKYQALGIRPEESFSVIQGLHRAATMGGISFDQADAAGMRTALALQGTGLTAESGLMIGARTEGSSQQIADRVSNGSSMAMNSRLLYNLGGQAGVQQSLERSSVAFMQSPTTTAAMMGAFDPTTGTFNRDIYTSLLSSGDINGAMNRASRSMGGGNTAQNMLAYKAALPEELSRMAESAPEMMAALTIQQTLGAAKLMGMKPEQMSVSALGAIAGSVTGGQVSASDFSALVEQIMAASEGAGRTNIMEQQQGEARMRTLHGGMWSSIGYDIRQTGAIRGLSNASNALHQDVGGFAYRMNRGITRFLDRGKGTYTADVNFDVMNTLREQGRLDDEYLGDFSSNKGRIYDEAGAPWVWNDQADIMEERLQVGVFRDMRKRRLMNTFQGDRLSLNQDETDYLRQDARSRGISEDRIKAAFQAGTRLGTKTSDPTSYYETNVITRENYRGLGFSGIESMGDLIAVSSDDLEAGLKEGHSRALAMAKAKNSYVQSEMTNQQLDDAREFYFQVISDMGGRSGVNNILSDERNSGEKYGQALVDRLRLQNISIESEEGQRRIGYAGEHLAAGFGVAGGKAVSGSAMSLGGLGSISDARDYDDRIRDAVDQMGGGTYRAEKPGVWGILRAAATRRNSDYFTLNNRKTSDEAQSIIAQGVAMYNLDGPQEKAFDTLSIEYQNATEQGQDLGALIRQMATDTGTKTFKERQIQIANEMVARDENLNVDSEEGGTGTIQTTGTGAALEVVNSMEDLMQQNSEVIQATAQMLQELIPKMNQLTANVDRNTNRVNALNRNGPNS